MIYFRAQSWSRALYQLFLVRMEAFMGCWRREEREQQTGARTTFLLLGEPFD
jgi:hypothetical protein